MINQPCVVPSEKPYSARLPWGITKDKPASIYNKSLLLSLKQNSTGLEASLGFSDASTWSASEADMSKDSWAAEKQKPGEYAMHLVMLNFIQQSSKKFEQAVSGERREKRLKECVQRGDDPQLDQLIQVGI